MNVVITLKIFFLILFDSSSRYFKLTVKKLPNVFFLVLRFEIILEAKRKSHFCLFLLERKLCVNLVLNADEKFLRKIVDITNFIEKKRKI